MMTTAITIGWPELLPLATYCALMSGTPGPNNVLLTSSGANFGYRRTLPHILGIVIGGAGLTMAACLGLGALLSAWPVLRRGLQVAGALYLLWLAWRLWGSAVGRAEMRRPLSFTQGAAFQLVNPKSWTRAITVAAVFMPRGAEPVQGALFVSGAGMLIGLPCISMWALFGVAIRRVLDDPRRRRVFNAIMALTLAVLALLFLR